MHQAFQSLRSSMPTVRRLCGAANRPREGRTAHPGSTYVPESPAARKRRVPSWPDRRGHTRGRYAAVGCPTCAHLHVERRPSPVSQPPARPNGRRGPLPSLSNGDQHDSWIVLPSHGSFTQAGSPGPVTAALGAAVTGEEWMRILLAMAILTALFVFPIVMIWRDERRKRRNQAQESEQARATHD